MRLSRLDFVPYLKAADAFRYVEIPASRGHDVKLERPLARALEGFTNCDELRQRCLHPGKAVPAGLDLDLVDTFGAGGYLKRRRAFAARHGPFGPHFAIRTQDTDCVVAAIRPIAGGLPDMAMNSDGERLARGVVRVHARQGLHEMPRIAQPGSGGVLRTAHGYWQA